MFLQVSVCPQGGHAWLLGGACVVALGGHVWLLGGACMVAQGACMVAPGGACMVAPGGACMVALGVCMVAPGEGMCGCSRGGVRGCSGGACMVAPGCVAALGGRAWFLWGGMHGSTGGGRAWFFRWDTVSERAIRILLECILVIWIICEFLEIFPFKMNSKAMILFNTFQMFPGSTGPVACWVNWLERKGFHCHAAFYAARISARNSNRAHNNKMLFHGKNPNPHWGMDIMVTFERCIANHANEFSQMLLRVRNWGEREVQVALLQATEGVDWFLKTRWILR